MLPIARPAPHSALPRLLRGHALQSCGNPAWPACVPRSCCVPASGEKGLTCFSETLPKLFSFHALPFRKLVPALGSPTPSLGSLFRCGRLSFSTAPSQPVRSHGAGAGQQEDPLQELLRGKCGALERRAGEI